MKTTTPKYKINHQIKAAELRVISSEGKQLGIMKLSEALNLAKKDNLDLIEIAPFAKPPVAKIIEFGKFKYQEEKKQQKEKRKSKTGELKEVRFTPFIADHDFKTRIERIKEFLEEKSKVRLTVKFTGKQLGSKQFGYNILDKIINEFNTQIVVDMEPKFIGRQLIMVISPTKKKNISK